MKTRESGMPDEARWESFFDPAKALALLGLPPEARDVVEFGGGYGAFTMAAARLVRGPIHAFDIESDLVVTVRGKARQGGLSNVVCEVRDFVEQGTGLAAATADYAMLFNILHDEQPEVLLREAWRVLRPLGRLGIMHWNYDPSTPRGPSLSIRPRPEDCRVWAEAAGFQLLAPGIINLPPYHYGMVMGKGAGG